MDALAHDFTSALEESAHRLSPSKLKNSITWKRSKSSSSLKVLGSSVPKSSAVSDDSESSLDERIKQMSTNSTRPQSDSDDVLKLACLSTWRHCVTNMGESDSVNENFHSSREPRRKRKFKRMAVDPPLIEPDLQTFSCLPLFSQKSRRVRNLKSMKSKQKFPNCYGNAPESVCSRFSEKICGKRKRSVRERSIECNHYDECPETLDEKLVISSDGTSAWSNTSYLMEYENLGAKLHETSSGLSSSESECGILTNDEGREADDEQSDFFYESGPSSGIPGIPAWWEGEHLLAENEGLSDPKFESLLARSLCYMTDKVKPIGCLQSGRQIKAGRRHLENSVQSSFMASNIKLGDAFSNSKIKHEPLNLPHDTLIGRTTIKDIKRRRRMLPSSGASQGDLDSFNRVDDANSHQGHQNIEWTSKTSLALERSLVVRTKNCDFQSLNSPDLLQAQ